MSFGALLIAGLTLAAPPRLVAELESVQQAGLFPVPGLDPESRTGFDDGSQTLFRWILRPSLEGLYETRRQEFSLSYRPRFLTQVNLDAGDERDVAGPLILHRGALDHVWHFDRGGDMNSRVYVESGEADVVLIAEGIAADEGPIGNVPPAPVIGYTTVGGSSEISLRTGNVESFTVGLESQYLVSSTEEEEGIALLPFYRLGTFVEYSHYLFPRLDGLIDIRMSHVEFFEEDRQSRQASMRAGVGWQQRRNLAWDFRAGVQVIVGEGRPLEEGGPPPQIDGAFPSGRLSLDWTFLQGAQGVAVLTSGLGVDAFIDPTFGAYIPRAVLDVGLTIFQPWGRFTTVGSATTPIVENVASETSFLPTFYRVRAELELPASPYVYFFMRGVVSQRAPSFFEPDFAFGFTEAVGEFGVRLWWSSGRDPRLPRPSERMDEDEFED